jgi:hypothetical protein
MKFEKLNKFSLNNIDKVSIAGGAREQTATVCEDYTFDSANHINDGNVETSDDDGKLIARRTVKY